MNHEQIGSCKTLTKNINVMRTALGRRGPWRSIPLREYHDELLYDIAARNPKKIKLGVIRRISSS